MERHRIDGMGLISALVLAICATASFAAPAIGGMEVIAENDHLRLTFDESTTSFAVLVKKSGSIWRSDSRSPLPGAPGSEILSIIYGTPGAVWAEMNSFQHSVSIGQYTVARIDGGVRIDYTLGSRYGNLKTSLPQVIGKERFERLILARTLGEEDRSLLLQSYAPIVLEKRPVGGDAAPLLRDRGEVAWWQFGESLRQPSVDTGNIGSFESTLLGGYRLVSLKEEDRDKQKILDELEIKLEDARKNDRQDEVRQLGERIEPLKASFDATRSKLMWSLVEKFAGKLSAAGARSPGFRRDITGPDDLRPSDFVALRDAPSYLLTAPAPFIITELEEVVRKTGYSVGDLALDNFAFHLDPPIPAIEVFRVPVEIRLDGDSLLVRVPMREASIPLDVPSSYTVDFRASSPEEGIGYDRSGAKESRPLYAVNLLRYFGAAGKDSSGYLFVPDGCGAIIDMNSRKGSSPVYNEPVYGEDRALPKEVGLPYTKERTCLPVFGTRQDGRGMLAVIEKGEAIADVRADVARDSNPYNIVYPAFNTARWSQIRGEQTQVAVYQKQPYADDLQVRYFFLEGDESTYAGMARRYQSYLVETQGLQKVRDERGLPFYLELIGAISDVRTVALIPRTVSVPLTTFAEARTIVKELLDSGVSNIKLRYTGWLDGGLRHGYPVSVSSDGVLGSRRDLLALRDYLDQAGVDLYPDVSFLYVYRNTLADGFSASRDASRYLTRLIAQLPQFDPVTLKATKSTYGYVLSPSRVGRTVDGFLSSFKRYGIGGLSLADLGGDINSDYREGASSTINRQQALGINAGKLAELEASFPDGLMVSEGNIYAALRARHLVNIPTSYTGQGITDRAVPFYQIVLHGFVSYAGEPINMSSDPRRALLKAMETGAALYYQMIYRDPSLVKQTDFDYLFSVHYDTWLQKAAESYREAGSVLGRLQSLRIVDHSQLSEQVSRTLYEDGTTITVNYGDAAVEVDGVRLGALDYVVGGGGGR